MSLSFFSVLPFMVNKDEYKTVAATIGSQQIKQKQVQT